MKLTGTEMLKSQHDTISLISRKSGDRLSELLLGLELCRNPKDEFHESKHPVFSTEYIGCPNI